MSTALIDAPRGLNGLAVTSTSIGDVRGEEGFFHYHEYDAVELARTRHLEDVWSLLLDARLDGAHLADEVRLLRHVPSELRPVVEAVARTNAPILAATRAVVSVAAGALDLRPLIDTDAATRRGHAVRTAACIPAIVAALWRSRAGLPPVEADADLGHASAYLQMVTGSRPSAELARALEQYLILTVDHGFNASTFTARVVASTGADMADVVSAGIGALSGPLHGGAPSRALDALDAIGDPSAAATWARAELAAGRRIMGFGHAVYRTVDPRSALLQEVALGLGSPRAHDAVMAARAIEEVLADKKPGRALRTNVEYFAGVVMEACGLPRELFTPTFAVSRVIAWTVHALEQTDESKLIRPSARYVGPPAPTPLPD